MRPRPKGKVTIGVTRQVKPIRIGELRGVAVRSAQQQDEELLWADSAAGKFNLLWNTAGHHLKGRLVTQQLFDSDISRLRLRAEASELFWMLEQDGDGVCDRGRHVAGS